MLDFSWYSKQKISKEDLNVACRNFGLFDRHLNLGGPADTNLPLPGFLVTVKAFYDNNFLSHFGQESELRYAFIFRELYLVHLIPRPILKLQIKLFTKFWPILSQWFPLTLWWRIWIKVCMYSFLVGYTLFTWSNDQFWNYKYRISAISFRGNYSFLNLALCTETIQGRKLFAEIQYTFVKLKTGDLKNWQLLRLANLRPFLAIFGQVLKYLSQNLGSDGHFEGLNMSES